MLLTARAGTGPVAGRGVIGHARSPDLISWTVEPPLTAPGNGFGYLEVPQVQMVDGRPVLIFSCDPGHLAPDRAESVTTGGIWAVPIADLVGPYDLGPAQMISEGGLYVGKLVQDPQDNWVLMAFVERDERGDFGGYIIDPLAVCWDGDLLRVTGPQFLPGGGPPARH